MPKIGIIAGTGIDDSIIKATGVIFLNRHGREYRAPHEIDYRGNILALQRAGVEKIVALAAVGSLNKKMKPGDFLLLSDFIDLTRNRTEYLSAANFTDVSFPYDEALRRKIKQAAAGLGIRIHPKAVYACTEGPRYESKAEIAAYRRLGADVVGMTQVPEVVLAAETGIPYAVIGIVTNYAAGISRKKISSQEVMAMMKNKSAEISKLLLETIKRL
ncbi:MAG: MTAP family purine nucleoside phosphorylase [Candidatus Margulisbacteria bacterium]|nr:MTAP family purine nucleoside phosphorylase [Candidatus Margulisiibacteriota bacterium]